MGYVAWANASNGAIPTSKMVDLDGSAHFLNPNAAVAFRAWDADFFARTGIHITISEAFRSLATQQYYRDLYISRKGFPASQVGESSHGQGLAVDVNSWVYSARQSLHDTLEATGKAHGWSWTLVGKPSGEPWHFNYIGDPYVDFSKLATVIGGLASSLSTLGENMARVILRQKNGLCSVVAPGFIKNSPDDRTTQVAEDSYGARIGYSDDDLRRCLNDNGIPLEVYKQLGISGKNGWTRAGGYFDESDFGLPLE